VELLKINLERVKLLEHSKGVYSTHKPPLTLYWEFYRSLRELENSKGEVSDVLQEISERFQESSKDDSTENSQA